MSLWLFDVSLALLLLALALGALHSPDVRAGVTLYIAFGLVLALTWARFGAVDLAFAEAAIGAGLTGAVLLSALRSGTEGARSVPGLRGWVLVAGVAATILLAIAAYAVQRLDAVACPLPEAVGSQLPRSGVDHPVTAVLLNFRAWDTWLELMVVLVAAMGLRPFTSGWRSMGGAPWRVLSAWSRVMAPLLVVVSGYVLWRGAVAPGGAFQAGALLAAGAVVLCFSGVLAPLRWSQWWVRLSVALGVGAFLVAALALLASGYGWLEYPEPQAKAWIVTIEVAATWSIAVSLTLLVMPEREVTGS